jgi:hypothetical protein
MRLRMVEDDEDTGAKPDPRERDLEQESARAQIDAPGTDRRRARTVEAWARAKPRKLRVGGRRGDQSQRIGRALMRWHEGIDACESRRRHRGGRRLTAGIREGLGSGNRCAGRAGRRRVVGAAVVRGHPGCTAPCRRGAPKERETRDQDCQWKPRRQGGLPRGVSEWLGQSSGSAIPGREVKSGSWPTRRVRRGSQFAAMGRVQTLRPRGR